MANRTNDCAGVCAEVRERLVKINLIGPEVQRHQPVYEALDKIVFMTKEDLTAMVEAYPEIKTSWLKKYL
jgi:hypothetical protein